MTKTKRILIVDDEAEIRHVLVDLLRRPGWHIETAEDGQDALDRLRTEAFDVIISDILMPRVDGMDLLQRVQASHPKTRVILITGVGTSDWAKQAIRLGAFDYMEKPFDLPSFRQVIESAVAARPARSRRAAGSPTGSQIGRDALTGLWTHRHFFEHLAFLRARCRRCNEPLSVLIIDIDDFSRINAEHGYAAGDEVLIEVSRRLTRAVRESDIAARYGSEEFIVALPQTGAQRAALVAERIWRAIRSQPIEPAPGQSCAVTVSIGLCECETGFIETEDDIVRRATEALRLAKARGKDRFLLWMPHEWDDPQRPRPDLQSVQALTSQLEEINQRLKQTYLESTRALVAAVEAKDPYTEAHSMTVALYAEGVARRMDLEHDIVQVVRTAALLHDVGKIGIPDHILTKPGRLSEAEWEVVRRHTLMGVQILEHASFLRAELPIILYHHEWWDGTGYPEGLAGERIPLGSRILNVADAMDAMFSRRAYKHGYTKEKVIEELQAGAGTQFDPQVVEAAIAWIRENPDDIVYPAMRRKVQVPTPAPAMAPMN